MQYLRPELHRQVYKVRHGNTATTKLDAPYTMVSIRGQASRVPVSSEVKGVKLRALNVHLQDLMPPESPTATATTKPAAALIQKLPNPSNQISRVTLPPVIVRRHLVSSSDLEHRPRAAPKLSDNVEKKYESQPIPDDVEYGNKPGSILIIREESEGKDPGTPCKGKDGNIFMVRRHLTRNPFERLEDIQKVGEITSRDQAMGLHSQYHLALDRQLRKS